MERAYKIVIWAAFILIHHISFAQNEKAFCNAVESLNFKKAERQIKKLVRNNSKGKTYFNGEGSGYQITFTPCLDSITNWLKKQHCVKDAFWDKCQEKISIYPGWSTIGIKFITKKGEVEKCISIQEGTTGQVEILGWRPKLSKEKHKLIYKKMFDCKGFIELQKFNCFPNSKNEQNKEGIIPEKLVGKWKMIKIPKGMLENSIEFKMVGNHELELTIDSSFTYSFSSHLSKKALSAIGFIANWPPYNCYVNQLDDDFIQIEYSCIGQAITTIMYSRIKE